MINLYSSYYAEINRDRVNEIDFCLSENCSNDDISRISIFLEGNVFSKQKSPKIFFKSVNRRPTYNDYFEWIRESTRDNSCVSIVSNSDIYFDRNILALCQVLKPNQCAVLSRWDLTASGEPHLFDRKDSQDVWVFRGPVKQVYGDFPVGVPRCDNRILYQLKQAGYEIINPAFSIRAYHLHAGQRQEYSNANLGNFVDPPYAYLWPHNLWSLPRTLLYNFKHPDARVSWRFDRRRFLNLLPIRAILKLLRVLTRQ